MAKKSKAETPVAEPKEVGEVLVTPEEAVLPNGKCPDCSMKYEVCSGKHVIAVLPQKCLLNGVKFGPGECVVPANTDLFAPYIKK